MYFFVAACGGGTQESDAGADADVDATSDAAIDAAIDASSDGAVDASVDADTDGGVCDDMFPGPSGDPVDCSTITLPPLKGEELAVGFDLERPVFITQAPGGDELYVVEQLGTIRALDEDGNVIDPPFLDIVDRVHVTFEGGLLGMAFHPDYADNGRFFVNYVEEVDEVGYNVIAEYARSEGNPLQASGTEVQRLVWLEDFSPSHNGGMLQFGPDGFLYAGMGDGGGENDPLKYAQDRGNLFGTIMRLDVDAPKSGFAAICNPFSEPEGQPQIWAYGLRNPWRFSFDRLTHDMYIGDVGESAFEEINFIPAGSGGGHNFGWSAYEGNQLADAAQLPLSTPHVPPIDVIPHGADPMLQEAGSVTGGFVYRGSAIPALQGYYVFGDFLSNHVAAFKYCGGQVLGRQEIPGLSGIALDPDGIGLASFGEDNDGELYMVMWQNDKIFRIVPDEL